MAEIFANAGGERMVILAVREALSQPFEATNWLDLRIGFFLSITGATDDDDPTTVVAEDIGASDAVLIPWTDRIQIGLIAAGSGNFIFCGYTNKGRGGFERGETLGRSRLISSDASGGAGSDYWRGENGISGQWSTQIIENHTGRAHGSVGERPHFAQDVVAAGGYATMIALRFTRPDTRARAKLITMYVKHDPTELLFNNDPSIDIVQSQLESFPTTGVHTLGPVQLSLVPDHLWLYWPFHDSRLRIHAAGILKIAG